MFTLASLLNGAVPPINIVDVGAMYIQRECYQPLIDQGIAHLVGFDPDQTECDKLNGVYGGGHTFLPCFIGDGRTRTFHRTNTGMSSSFYEPNTALLEHFQNLENLMQAVDSTPVATRRLDDIPEAADTDYLKIDVDGAEVEVFEGARKVLAVTTIVHTEVQFVPLYQDVPLFSDVDCVLRQQGFLFHQIYGLAGRAFKPVLQNNDPNARMSQWLWGDALYVKNFMDFAALPPLKLLKLAIVLHEVYRSYDLCALALRHYDQQTEDSLWQEYLQRLTKHATPQAA